MRWRGVSEEARTPAGKPKSWVINLSGKEGGWLLFVSLVALKKWMNNNKLIDDDRCTYARNAVTRRTSRRCTTSTWRRTIRTVRPFSSSTTKDTSSSATTTSPTCYFKFARNTSAFPLESVSTCWNSNIIIISPIIFCLIHCFFFLIQKIKKND